MTNTAAPTLMEHSSWELFRVMSAGICSLVLTVGLARFAYTPMLPIMAKQASLSLLAGGWLAAIHYAGYMAGALIASSIGDLNKKFVLYRAGLVLGVLSTAAMGLTTDVKVWAVLRFISGLAGTAGMLLASGLILNWLIRNGKRAQLGLHFTGLGLGIALSGLVVATSSRAFTWDYQWVILGAIGLLLFVPAWLWLPRPAPIQQHASAPSAAPVAPSSRWMVLSILSYFCAGFGFAIGATFIVAILEKLPMFTGNGGWVWVGVGLTAVPSTFLWDRAAKAMGSVHALIVAYALHAVCIAIPVLSDAPSLNLVSALLFGGTFAGIVSLTLAIVGRHFPANPAKAMARMTLSYGVAQIGAPAMAGYIAKATGNYHDALIVTIFLLGAGLVLLRLLAREEAKVQTASQAS
ncbi:MULTISPECIES: YbfB/YjiJ family MFS transporter [unclassified Delftia]|uniref:YbfB/YjiJ family MFS transporter n=1 Tax=unclassified Delftia TaxID=2613839 RepID=UPI001F1722BA|nr:MULTISPECIES: YbfB/YjiJ family MFS transporter [unclassified Delftia]MBK0114084.1 YbfB/YjiJ family MFS transporter [Delftia sp. S65]MBK0117892.1 YbfB/YjiJ family MFS transporter [Delftia sp. S67]MBK0129109.1 YbfB/YjiJ family MFS transporter [Delftia sp. S66]